MTARNQQGNDAPTRINIRAVRAQDVHAAMLAHADQIADVRDVLRLPALRDMAGESVAVAVADLVADGLVAGATGAGRIRAVERP